MGSILSLQYLFMDIAFFQSLISLYSVISLIVPLEADSQGRSEILLVENRYLMLKIKFRRSGCDAAVRHIPNLFEAFS